MKGVMALILAGGTKPPMEILCIKRTKAAVPFAGFYRIIDFPLSNLMNSGVEKVGVLAQHRPDSLMDHIGGGIAWDFIGRERIVQILPPHANRSGTRWYQGTADAINQNMAFLEPVSDLSHVLVVAGDHVYHMDYNEVLEFHRSKNADLTLVTKYVDKKNNNNFGRVKFDDSGRITDYEENPEIPDSDYISLCIYVFSIKFLVKALKKFSKYPTTHDIGREIIIPFLKKARLYAYNFQAPWYYLGNIQEYWEANMEVIKANSKINLKKWNVCTNLDDRDTGIRPPARILATAHVEHSMVSDGCVIMGKVINSILSPGIMVGKNAVVKDSVILHDCHVQPGAWVEQTILDKDVRIGEKSKVGVGRNIINTQYPEFFHSGITVIGRSIKIPPKSIIGKNCVIFPGNDFSTGTIKHLESGKTINNRSDAQ